MKTDSKDTIDRLVRGSAACIAAQVVYMIARFLITPYIVLRVGYAGYGFWAVLFALLGVLGVHRLGLSAPVIAFASEYIGRGRPDRVRAVLATSGSVALAFAVVIGIGLFAATDLVLSVAHVNDELRAAAAATWRITVLVTLIGMVLGGFQSALEALQQHPRVRLVDTLASLAEAGLSIGLLAAGLGLPALAIAYALRVTLPIPIYAVMLRRRLPGVHALPGRIDRSEARRVIRFGASIQALGILHLATAALDRLLLANIVSLAATGVYELARKLITLAGALPVQGLAPIAPAASRLTIQRGGDARNLAGLIRTTTRLLAWLAALPLVVFAVAGDAFLHAWMGERLPEVARALSWLCVGAYAHLLTGPTTAALRGLARPRPELAYAVLWILGALVAIPPAAAAHGVVGGAAAASMAQTFASLVLLAVGWPLLGISRRDWVQIAVLPLLAAGAPALLAVPFLAPLTASSTRLDSATTVLVVGTLVAVGSFPLFLFLVLDRHERTALRSRFLTLLPRRMAAAAEARA